MELGVYENTKVAAYFLWEYTRHDNALALWYCAEDMAFFLENKDVLDLNSLYRFIQRSKYDITYINFVKQIAYRVYLFTGNADHIKNWFVSETLLQNGEWIHAMVRISAAYRMVRDGHGDDIIGTIKTEKIRALLY